MDTEDSYIQIDIQYIKLFDYSKIEELTKCMFPHIKKQIEKPKMSQRNLTLNG